MKAPSVLVIQRNTLRKKAKDAITFFDLKDLKIDINNLEKVE